MLVGEPLAGLGDELVHQASGRLRLRLLGPRRQRRHAEALRVGVGDALGEPVAAQHEQEAMLAYRLDEDLDAGKR